MTQFVVVVIFVIFVISIIERCLKMICWEMKNSSEMFLFCNLNGNSFIFMASTKYKDRKREEGKEKLAH